MVRGVTLSTLIAPLTGYFDARLNKLFTMNVDTTITTVEELEIIDGANRRRRITDIAQPLEYVAKVLVREFIRDQQRIAPPQNSFFEKLLKMRNE